MSEDGFDISELSKFSTDMLAIANDKMPKESKKFIKKQGALLSKKNKAEYSSCGVGSGIKEFAKYTLTGFKAGKVYKYDGALSVRAYNGTTVINKAGKKYSLGGMLNNGFVHVNRDGSESFVPGYHFMEKALSSFNNEYVLNCETFVYDVVVKNI